MISLADARKIARIVETAEGGCKGCMAEAVRSLNLEFPDYNWTVLEHAKYMRSIEVDIKTAKRPPVQVRRYKC